MPRSSTRSIRPRPTRCRQITSTPSAPNITPWVDCAATCATAISRVEVDESAHSLHGKLHLHHRLFHAVRPRRPQEYFAARTREPVAVAFDMAAYLPGDQMCVLR